MENIYSNEVIIKSYVATHKFFSNYICIATYVCNYIAKRLHELITSGEYRVKLSTMQINSCKCILFSC